VDSSIAADTPVGSSTFDPHAVTGIQAWAMNLCDF
jgi:hypothetical protein